MRRTLASATGVAAIVTSGLLASCSTAPAPFGEALIVVATDVAIPHRVNRLRVDVYGKDGALLESRDILAARPEEWPISLSVANDGDEERQVTVRLRAYPEGHVATRAEIDAETRASSSPRIAYGTIDEACSAAPTLTLGVPVTLRRGEVPITNVLPYRATPAQEATCTADTRSGSVAAKLVIEEEDFYRVEIASAVPDGANGAPGGDTTLSLRAECPFPTSQMACNDADGNRLSGLTLELAPGTYWVVTGGRDRAPADLTLLATRANSANPVAPPPAPVRDPSALEPAPGATIDRLVRLRLVPGERGTLQVPLLGECLGTRAKLATGESCTDRAGELAPVDIVFTRGRLVREAPPLPSWSGDAVVPCTVPPRTGRGWPWLDEEVCTPGGAFVLGDTLALSDQETRSRPERVRVIEPFLIDKYEFTVGRFRDAIKNGFAYDESLLRVNNDPLVASCTWNTGASPVEPAAGIARESLPLNCIAWEYARAVCTFLGSDLPTEDQWEYAATAAGRPKETQYPWGDALPTCDRAVYERAADTSPPGRCAGNDVGPVAVDAEPWATGDRTPLGVVGLGGNVQEWTRTAFHAYGDSVWESAGLRGKLPNWAETDAPRRTTRGGDWYRFVSSTTSSQRGVNEVAGRFFNVGFRCARGAR